MAKKATPPKSPINVVRDIKTISNEYGATCAKLGEAHVKIKNLEKETDKIKLEILDLHSRVVELVQEHMDAIKHLEKKAEQETKEQDKTA